MAGITNICFFICMLNQIAEQLGLGIWSQSAAEMAGISALLSGKS